MSPLPAMASCASPLSESQPPPRAGGGCLLAVLLLEAIPTLMRQHFHGKILVHQVGGEYQEVNLKEHKPQPNMPENRPESSETPGQQETLCH